MSDEQSSDKEFEPTQKKLDDARKKGEIAKSMDLITAAGYGGFTIAAIFAGPSALIALGTDLRFILANVNELSQQMFSGSPQPGFRSMLSEIAVASAVWFVFPIVAVCLCIIAQQAFVVAPSKLKMKGSRISLISGVKNKFGRTGIFEFFKSFSKLAIYGLILGLFISAQNDRMVGALYLFPAAIVAEIGELIVGLLWIVVIVAASIGIIDFVWQKAEHTRKNKMSRKEIMDETKQSEGDPAMKHQRRQRGYDIAMNKMMADVPAADVVIVNPTHFAVALSWDRLPGSTPICIAKGVDETAAKIREIAVENAVPIHSDAPTARAIYATIAIGETIDEGHFPAVAAALRFADKIRAKAIGSLNRTPT